MVNLICPPTTALGSPECLMSNSLNSYVVKPSVFATFSKPDPPKLSGTDGSAPGGVSIFFQSDVL